MHRSSGEFQPQSAFETRKSEKSRAVKSQEVMDTNCPRVPVKNEGQVMQSHKHGKLSSRNGKGGGGKVVTLTCPG